MKELQIVTVNKNSKREIAKINSVIDGKYKYIWIESDELTIVDCDYQDKEQTLQIEIPEIENLFNGKKVVKRMRYDAYKGKNVILEIY